MRRALAATCDDEVARALWKRATRLRAAQRKYELAGDAEAADSFDAAIARAIEAAKAYGPPPVRRSKYDTEI